MVFRSVLCNTFSVPSTLIQSKLFLVSVPKIASVESKNEYADDGSARMTEAYGRVAGDLIGVALLCISIFAAIGFCLSK